MACAYCGWGANGFVGGAVLRPGPVAVGGGGAGYSNGCSFKVTAPSKGSPTPDLAGSSRPKPRAPRAAGYAAKVGRVMLDVIPPGHRMDEAAAEPDPSLFSHSTRAKSTSIPNTLSELPPTNPSARN